MRGFIPSYTLTTPASLADALNMLASEPGVWKPFAGGTDLMVLLESGNLSHRSYINIWQFAELREIEVTDDHVTLGALTTYTDVQAHPILREEFPMLCQAASETGGLAIQNRGTIGGNIVMLRPRLIHLRLCLHTMRSRTDSALALARISAFHGKQMQSTGSIVDKIRLPENRNSYHYYRKSALAKRRQFPRFV